MLMTALRNILLTRQQCKWNPLLRSHDNIQQLYIVDIDMVTQLYTERTLAFRRQQWLRESTTVLHASTTVLRASLTVLRASISVTLLINHSISLRYALNS